MTNSSADQEKRSQQTNMLRPIIEKLLRPSVPWRAIERTRGDVLNKHDKINLALRLQISS